jgi:hypothetical protein
MKEYRVYLDQPGSDLVYCGARATAAEAAIFADSSPGGLERCLWDTARNSGTHCGGYYPPGEGEEGEVISWHGEGSRHCVVPVYDTTGV